MTAALIIVNHNGRDLLAESVPAALAAARRSEGHEVVVADDGSSDGSVAFVRDSFPNAKTLALPRGGFGATCNTAAAAAKSEIAVLLNSDVIVASDFLQPLLDDLTERDVFAVGCEFLNPDGTLTNALGNRTSGEWHGGLLRIHHETRPERLTETCPQLYANGGGMAFWRDKWLELGGFDPLFRPFYWEDVDIGYRAWGRGWRVLFEPRSTVYHNQGSTMGRLYSPAHIELMSAKNGILFAWKNLQNAASLRRAMAAQARWAADDVLIGGLPPRTAALWRALRQLGQACRARARERRARLRSDADILSASAGERS